MGYIPDWRSLSKVDQEEFIPERRRLGIQRGRGSGGGGSGVGGSSITTNPNKLKQLQNLKKYKLTIKVLRKRKDPNYQYIDGAREYGNAYDQFGGHNSKKNNNKKRSTWLVGLSAWIWIITKVVQYLYYYNAMLTHGQTIHRQVCNIKSTDQRSVASEKRL